MPTKRLHQSFLHYLLYGGTMAVLVFALKWLEWKYLITGNSFEIYVGLIALFFTLLGGWAATQWINSRKKMVVEKTIFVPSPGEMTIDEAAVREMNLSNREYEVLKLIAMGCSNQQIADRLYLSLSTVKTHVSNLLVKLDVKSRTQAIEKANRLRITP